MIGRQQSGNDERLFRYARYNEKESTPRGVDRQKPTLRSQYFSDNLCPVGFPSSQFSNPEVIDPQTHDSATDGGNGDPECIHPNSLGSKISGQQNKEDERSKVADQLPPREPPHILEHTGLSDSQ
jgi:hypothetical protein